MLYLIRCFDEDNVHRIVYSVWTWGKKKEYRTAGSSGWRFKLWSSNFSRRNLWSLLLEKQGKESTPLTLDSWKLLTLFSTWITFYYLNHRRTCWCSVYVTRVTWYVELHVNIFVENTEILKLLFNYLFFPFLRFSKRGYFPIQMFTNWIFNYLTRLNAWNKERI